jgi:hypothetical protein
LAKTTFRINRAPVLTLWAAVVAERLGFDRDKSLSLAKALAGLNAQTKGKRLGIYAPTDEMPPAAKRAARAKGFLVDLLGRPVPAVKTDNGVRATSGGKPVDPAGVAAYLERAFGDHLDAARAAMKKLAKAYRPAALADAAFGLYEQFRPAIPAGVRGWGAKGELDLAMIGRLAKKV